MKRTDITALFPNATDEQIKTLMDLNGADINAAKSGMNDLQTQLAAARSEAEAAKRAGADAESAAELKKAIGRAAELEKELNGLKLANSLRELREKVAKEKGVPAALLSGDTEDACKAQADGILAFSKQQGGYPALPDGGEFQGAPAGATRDRFAAWAQQNLI